MLSGGVECSHRPQRHECTFPPGVDDAVAVLFAPRVLHPFIDRDKRRPTRGVGTAHRAEVLVSTRNDVGAGARPQPVRNRFTNRRLLPTTNTANGAGPDLAHVSRYRVVVAV